MFELSVYKKTVCLKAINFVWQVLSRTSAGKIVETLTGESNAWPRASEVWSFRKCEKCNEGQVLGNFFYCILAGVTLHIII